MIKENLRKILESIQANALKYGIKHSIKLVAVSKYSDVDSILEAYNAGQLDFGENKVQDLRRKESSLSKRVQGLGCNGLDSLSTNSLHHKFANSSKMLAPHHDSLESKSINWHFIGRLQENKINMLLSLNIALLHSLHSLKLAYALQERLQRADKTLMALLQVNSAQVNCEDSKQGFHPDTLLESYEEIAQNCPNIILSGLMCMGANTDNRALIDKSFKITKRLFDKISKVSVGLGRKKIECNEITESKKHEDVGLRDSNLKSCLDSKNLIISMGMSGDYEIAIANGSNCVRIGSSVFKV